MKFFFQFLVVVLLGVLFSGCFQTKEAYQLNADGSGKVHVEASFQKMNINLGGGEQKTDPKTEMKKAVQETLEKSKGIETWKDVSFKQLADGKIYFKGTAYFKNLKKVQLNIGGIKTEGMKPVLRSKKGGELVLTFKSDKKKRKKGAASKLDPEAVKAKMVQTKAQYQQMKPMMMAMFNGLKVEQSFQLPGNVTSHSNFQKVSDNQVKLEMKGEELLKVIDTLLSDESWLTEQVEKGIDVNKDFPMEGNQFNKLVFGEAAPVKATFSGGDPLFDYQAEVKAAKTAYPGMLKALNLKAKAKPQPVATGQGLKSVTVGGVRLIKKVEAASSDMSLRPFNHEPGYAMALLCELPGRVLKVEEGLLEEATSDQGEDLLPEGEWKRKIQFVQLSKEGTEASFTVQMNLPKKGTTGMKRVQGKLTYATATQTKEIDLGINEFKEGAAGNKFEAKIKKLGASSWNPGKFEMQLFLGEAVNGSSVKEVKFLDEKGEELKVQSSSRSTFNGQITMGFTSEEKWPEKGKVVLIKYADMKKFEAPFVIENITLLGEQK